MEMSEKNKIRAWIKKERKAVNSSTELLWNASISRKLLELPEISKSYCIYCYASFHKEAGTWEFMEELIHREKLVAVPKVTGKELEFYIISGKMDLEEGVMGIMEPKESCLKVHDPNAPVIVPGLAFDHKGNRIGYGGGYYDRFFEREPDHYRIAIAYEFQIMEQIKANSHDIPVDRVVVP